MYLLQTFDFIISLQILAIQQGQIVLPNETLLSVTGPLALLLIFETPLISLSSYPTLVASYAGRIRSVVGDQKILVETGLRRAQGPGAALMASQYSYMGGFDFSSNLMAASQYHIPLMSTMSHAFVSSFSSLDQIQDFILRDIDIKEAAIKYLQQMDITGTQLSELAAFLADAYSFPDKFACLLDTFNTLESGVPNCIAVILALQSAGYTSNQIMRIDSGNLIQLSLQVKNRTKELLDRLKKQKKSKIKIMVSNRIDWEMLQDFKSQPNGADIFAIGTDIVTCRRDPHLGMVYKLVELNGVPKMKFSQETFQMTLPGRQNILRFWGDKYPIADIITLENQSFSNQQPVQVINFFQYQEYEEAVTLIPNKVDSLLQVRWKNGVSLNKVESLEATKIYTQERLDLFGTEMINSNTKLPIFASEKYFEYFNQIQEKLTIVQQE